MSLLDDPQYADKCLDLRYFDSERLLKEHEGSDHELPPECKLAKGPKKPPHLVCRKCRGKFSAAPWEYLHDVHKRDSQDVVDAYLGLRYSQRQAFLAKANWTDQNGLSCQDAIEGEQRRIALGREKFATLKHNIDLVEATTAALNEWKTLVRGRKAEERNGQSENFGPDPEKEPTLVAGHCQTYVESTGAKESSNAGVMYFKRSSDGQTWIGTECEGIEGGAKFPDQKTKVETILGGKDCKIDKTCPPNTLRYIHFPANNMEWIEVGSPNRPWPSHVLTAVEARYEEILRPR